MSNVARRPVSARLLQLGRVDAVQADAQRADAQGTAVGSGLGQGRRGEEREETAEHLGQKTALAGHVKRNEVSSA